MNRMTRYLPFMIVAMGVLAYVNMFSNPFIFDDNAVIVGNRSIQHIWPVEFNVGARVVTNLTFKLNYAIGGLNVADYHATNLAIHIGAGLLLFGLIRRTLRLQVFGAKYMSSADWLAAVISSIWVVHPLQTQSVTYICQRYESLMGMFFFLALYCFARGVAVAVPGCSVRSARIWLDACIIVCIVGMGTKEVMAMAPLVIALYDYVFVTGSVRESIRARWRFHVAAFLSCSVVVFLQMLSISRTGNPVPEVSPLTYSVTQLGVITHYLRLAVIPYPLCLDYAWPVSSTVKDVIGPAILIACLGCTAVWGTWKRMGAGFLTAAFLIVLAPTSSFMPLGDLIFEHRMYVPLAAVMAFLVMAVYEMYERISRKPGGGTRWRPVVWIIPWMVVCVVFSAMTAMRNRDYRSTVSMWRDVVEKSTWNMRARAGLISALMGERLYDEAETAARRFVAEAEGRRDDEPAPAQVLVPIDGSYHKAAAYGVLGRVLLHQSRNEEARSCLAEALRIRPDDKLTHHNMALALWFDKREEEALREWNKVTSMDPEYAPAYLCKGMVHSSRREYEKAYESFRRGADIDGDSVVVKSELAWLLATCPDERFRDGREAIRLATEILEDTDNRSYRAFDILGAALAENGEFEKAEHAACRAIKLLESISSNLVDPGELHLPVPRDVDNELGNVRKRALLYSGNVPYRQ